MSALAAELLARADKLDRVLDEIEAMKLAFATELDQDWPDENTLLAIKNRMRSLDGAAADRMVW